ncbi:MAG: EamA family transporter RarD [Bacteroidales bacterium]|nr:EamA family transporter RarD [Bacteroidales bacterium]
MGEDRKGLVYGFLCYFIWGLFPLYWRMLEEVDSFEILAHRMLWSGIFMVSLFVGIRRVRLRDHIKCPQQYLMLLVTSVLISFNWGLYIWAINHGYILQSSLGYYINPLVNVLLGYLFLHERLNRAQTIALLLALAGVLYFTINYGHFPLISIGLAFSFGIYGLLKKKMGLNATPALTVETIWMMPVAIVYITFLYANGQSAMNSFEPMTWLLLLLAGAVTAIPLLLYGKAAERITLTTLGFLQYVSPTGQFLIGILIYKETFTTAHIVCFSSIWLGLIIFTFDMLKRMQPKGNAKEPAKK